MKPTWEVPDPVETLVVPRPGVPGRVARARGVAVSLEGISKSYRIRGGWRNLLLSRDDVRSVPALHQISCEIREGELFGLLGANGAGKSTLLRILATLVTPDAGKASVAGLDVTRQAHEVRRIMAPVFSDERSLNWRLSGRENLRLYAALYGLDPSTQRLRIGETLALVGLTESADNPVAGYSSGMKQRLLLARALVARPRVLLLDEPTRALDPLSARGLRSFLQEEVVRRQGCTVVLATHTTEEAMSLCTRLGVLEKGRLALVAPPEELARSYGAGRYRMWTRHPDHTCFSELQLRGALAGLANTDLRDGDWVAVEAEITGGGSGAAAVLTNLVTNGVAISHFEPVRATLADLIDRIAREKR